MDLIKPTDMSKGSFIFRKNTTVILSHTKEEQAWHKIFGNVPNGTEEQSKRMRSVSNKAKKAIIGSNVDSSSIISPVNKHPEAPIYKALPTPLDLLPSFEPPILAQGIILGQPILLDSHEEESNSRISINSVQSLLARKRSTVSLMKDTSTERHQASSMVLIIYISIS